LVELSGADSTHSCEVPLQPRKYLNSVKEKFVKEKEDYFVTKD